MRIYSLLMVLTLGACLSAESSPTTGHGSESLGSNSRDKRLFLSGSLNLGSSLLGGSLLGGATGLLGGTTSLLGGTTGLLGGGTGLLGENGLLAQLLRDTGLTTIVSGVLNVNGTLAQLLGGPAGLISSIGIMVNNIFKTLDQTSQKSIVSGLARSPMLGDILSHVTGPNGLLASVGDVLNVVSCVLKRLHLDLGTVLDLLKAVTHLEQISVLKMGCNSTVGADLIGGLLGAKGGLTSLLNNLVCTVGDVVNGVFTSLQLQVAKGLLLSLPGFECSNGTILNGTTSLLGLTSLVDSVFGGLLSNNQMVSLVTNIFKNPSFLSGVLSGGGVNFLNNILQAVVCLLNKLGFGDVLKLVSNTVTPKQLLNLDLICVNSSNDLLSTILGDKNLLNNIPLLAEIACLVNKGIPVKDILSLTGPTNLLTFTEGACEAGLLTNLLSNVSAFLIPMIQELQKTLNITLDQLNLEKVIVLANALGLYGGDFVTFVAELACFVKKLGLFLVTDIIRLIGIDKMLQFSTYVCKNGQPLFDEFDALTQAKFVTAMGIFNVSDLTDIYNALKCLAEKLSWSTVLDFAIAVKSLDPLRCEQVTVGSLIGLIAGLVDNLGVDIVNYLLAHINPLVLLDLAKIFYINGSFNTTLFEKVKCMLANINVRLNAGGLITSQSDIEVLFSIMCPNGSAINFPEKQQQYLDVYRLCHNGLTAECQSIMTATINKDSCKACMTNEFCDGVNTYAPQEAATECYAECVACTQATG
ncbi:hypothetical protein Bpfe_010672 [Biomphalaria pfeifferi]|uniref:Uncharacterized protein n=1 Tax=Biomphalaria pfeifferi TaxID=112525 RepID=A0AAD8BTA7_BIOPF|nr:hypothetical protein Bpfe_010672 [Biomphalaria pfeifferi]